MLFTNFVVVLRSRITKVKIKVTLTLAPGHNYVLLKRAARARRWPPGEKCEGNWKIFLMSLVDF